VKKKPTDTVQEQLEYANARIVLLRRSLWLVTHCPAGMEYDIAQEELAWDDIRMTADNCKSQKPEVVA
jgi:hypothetical protein